MRLILFHDRDPYRPGAPSTYRPDALIASAAGLRPKPALQKSISPDLQTGCLMFQERARAKGLQIQSGLLAPLRLRCGRREKVTAGGRASRHDAPVVEI